jgi:hypothetical protein
MLTFELFVAYNVPTSSSGSPLDLQLETGN